MYIFAQWFIFWRQDHEKSDCQMLCHNIYTAYPLHKTCFGVFQSVFMILLELVWIICYFSWFYPRLFCLFAVQYQLYWSNHVQFQCHDSICLVAALILSSFQYLRISSAHLPNFHRNIALYSQFDCLVEVSWNIKFLLDIYYLSKLFKILLDMFRLALKTDVKKTSFVMCSIFSVAPW